MLKGRIFCLKVTCGAGKVAQWVGALAYKSEDLNSNPSNPCKKLCVPITHI